VHVTAHATSTAHKLVTISFQDMTGVPPELTRQRNNIVFWGNITGHVKSFPFL
jgi:hypothetical protein